MPGLWAFKHLLLQPISGSLESHVTLATALYPTPREFPPPVFFKKCYYLFTFGLIWDTQDLALGFSLVEESRLSCSVACGILAP